MLVNTSPTGSDTQLPASIAAVSWAGIVPHCSMRATRASSPPCHSTNSSPANTTKQATTRAIVTTGVRRVGFASRSGITGERAGSPPSRLRRLRRLRRRLGRRIATRRGCRELVGDRLEERRVEPRLRDPPHRGGRIGLGRWQDDKAPQVLPRVVAAGRAVLREVLAVGLVEGDDPIVPVVEGEQDPVAPAG